MQIKTITISIGTKGYCDIVDITHEVQKVINENGLKEGNALVFIPGATAGVTTIEYEPGLLKDYPQFFEKLIPSNAKYSHDETWDDANGFFTHSFIASRSFADCSVFKFEIIAWHLATNCIS